MIDDRTSDSIFDKGFDEGFIAATRMCGLTMQGNLRELFEARRVDEDTFCLLVKITEKIYNKDFEQMFENIKDLYVEGNKILDEKMKDDIVKIKLSVSKGGKNEKR